MKSLLMAGAAALAMGAAFSAQAAEYGYYTSSGAPYCNGLKFKVDKSTGLATGQGIYNTTYCNYPAADIGGYAGSVPALGKGSWYTFVQSSTSTDSLGLDYVITTYVNQPKLLWVVAIESTYYGVPFEVVNAGELIAGKPGAFKSPTGHKMLGTTIREGLAHLHS